MEIKDFTSENDALLFARQLVDTDHSVDAVKTADGVTRVRWIKNKKFITYDGKEFTDEVWMTEKEELICIQDLTEAHAKNIIRMMLRNDRQVTKVASDMLESLAAIAGMIGADNEDTESNNHILH